MEFYEGEELPKQLFNPEWKFRERALRSMETLCMDKRYADPEFNEAILLSTLRSAVIGTSDKIAYVINAALEILSNVL